MTPLTRREFMSVAGAATACALWPLAAHAQRAGMPLIGYLSVRSNDNYLVEALRRGDLSAAGRGLHNALQPAAEQLSPWIGRMKDHFEQLRFAGHQMSGSGTSYFGLSPNAGHARRAAARLRGLGWSNVYVVRGCL